MGLKDTSRRYSRHVIRTRRWQVLRMAVLERDGWRCCCGCGERRRLEVDHILPVRTHPELAWSPANLQTLAASCHARKTNVEMGRTAASPERQEWRRLVRETHRNPDDERNEPCSTL